MFYCSRNCQLTGNTWNTEAQLKWPPPPDRTWRRSCSCYTSRNKSPWACFSFQTFFFLNYSFLFSTFFQESVKSHQQCTFTFSHTDHKSLPDVPVTKLIKPVSWGEHMAWVQNKLVQGTLLNRKTHLSLSYFSPFWSLHLSFVYTHTHVHTLTPAKLVIHCSLW